MASIMNPSVHQPDQGFPDAPDGWSREGAQDVARDEGLALQADHWRVIAALQEYYRRHEDSVSINARDLHDALDELFHAEGGIRYVYTLLPGGPVAQGCRLAGLKPPAGAVNDSFGSVV